MNIDSDFRIPKLHNAVILHRMTWHDISLSDDVMDSAQVAITTPRDCAWLIQIYFSRATDEILGRTFQRDHFIRWWTLLQLPRVTNLCTIFWRFCSHECPRWQFCKKTHFPRCIAFRRISSIRGPCPRPRDNISSMSTFSFRSFSSLWSFVVGSTPVREDLLF